MITSCIPDSVPEISLSDQCVTIQKYCIYFAIPTLLTVFIVHRCWILPILFMHLLRVSLSVCTDFTESL